MGFLGRWPFARALRKWHLRPIPPQHFRGAAMQGRRTRAAASLSPAEVAVLAAARREWGEEDCDDDG
eukprot:8384864-Alexandrium_andersonii.AAC.1